MFRQEACVGKPPYFTEWPPMRMRNTVSVCERHQPRRAAVSAFMNHRRFGAAARAGPSEREYRPLSGGLLVIFGELS